METEKELLTPELKAEILKLIKDNLIFELAQVYDRHFNPSIAFTVKLGMIFLLMTNFGYQVLETKNNLHIYERNCIAN